MSSDVRYLRVDEIVQTISDTHKFDCDKLYAVNTSDVKDGKMLNPPLMDKSDLKGQFKKTIKQGDILFSEIRPANRHFAKVEIEDARLYVASTKLMVLRKFNNDVNNDYFYYWLTNNSFLNILQRRAENRICSFPQITFDLLAEYKVPVPSLETQEKIAKILYTIDKKIELNGKVISELETMAREIYEYRFLQFDFPNEVGKPYKSSGGRMVYSKELKREIPEGWEVKTLGDIIIENKKSPIKVSDVKGVGEYPFFTSGEEVLLNNEVLVDGLNCYMNTGGNGDIKVYNGKAAFSTDTWSIKGKDNCTAYLGQLLLSYKPRLDIKFFAGTGLKHLQKDLLKMEKIAMPSKEVLKSFGDIIDKLTLKITNNQLQNRELIELRDFLLPMLMNGQVTVK